MVVKVSIDKWQCVVVSLPKIPLFKLLWLLPSVLFYKCLVSLKRNDHCAAVMDAASSLLDVYEMFMCSAGRFDLENPVAANELIPAKTGVFPLHLVLDYHVIHNSQRQT